MRKFSMLAGIAIAAIGLTSVSAGSAFAAGCLDPNALPPMSLSHDDLKPNAGFGYNKNAYDQELAKGNSCGTTQQSYTGRDVLQSHPAESHSTPENSQNLGTGN